MRGTYSGGRSAGAGASSLRSSGAGGNGARSTGAREGRTGAPSARSTSARSAGAGANRSVRSVRIGDIDRLERERERADRTARARAGSRKPLIVIGVVAVLVTALVIAFLVLSHSSVFAIDNMEVVGAEHLTSSEMSQLVSVPQGTTLLSVDAEGIERSLKRDAWVQDVTVKRVFPSTLQVVVTEREIAAVVDIPMGATQTIQTWAISSDGMWLMAIPDQDSEVGKSLSPKIYEDAASVLHISGVPYGLVPDIGTYCTDGNVNNALSIVDGMTTELAGQVRSVTATDKESTLLTLENGVEIAFGTAENIRDKERVCLKIMEENPGKVSYINVRVVDRPTWRSI